MNLNNELSPIMTRLPFIGVINLNNEISPIMMTLPSIGVTNHEFSLGTNILTGEVRVAQIKRPSTCCDEKEL